MSRGGHQPGSSSARHWARLAALLLACAACHSASSIPADFGADGREPPALSVAAVQWNSTDAGVGSVSAVTELQEQVYVFGEGGAQVFAAGAPISADSSVTAWKSAATIPAADGNGLWPVGLDAQGQLHHVRASGALETVSDRYGLAGQPVLDVESLGNGLTGFALGTWLAVADGHTVTRYDGAFPGVAGSQGRAAWVARDEVKRFDPVAGRVESWSLPGATLVAMNSDGRLAAATDRAVYYEAGTANLNQVYTAAPGAKVQALAGAGARFWFGVDKGQLGIVERGAVQRTVEAHLDGASKLQGSPTGDVWVLGAAGLQRFASAGADDFSVWQQTVLPVFARVCASCHLPTGTAGVNLASYEQWKLKKALIYARVVSHDPSPMPPAGSGVTLSSADLDAIKSWAGTP